MYHKTVALGLVLFIFGFGFVDAQVEPRSQGVAEYIKISGDTIRNGSIIALLDGSYQLANSSYSTHMYGVMVENPTVAISLIGRNEAYPVITAGRAEVLVSTQNGSIEQGDYITTSQVAGVGMKATQPGFVVGVAQAGFNAEGEGVVPVSVDIKFVSTIDPEIEFSPQGIAQQIQNVLTVGLRAVSSEPNSALRYAAAALVLIASIAFGFMIFGRAATNGVAAVGRNPLAKKTIFVMVIFNIIMTVAFALAGVGLAIAILAL